MHDVLTLLAQDGTLDAAAQVKAQEELAKGLPLEESLARAREIAGL